MAVRNTPSAVHGEAAWGAGLQVRLPCPWVCSDPPPPTDLCAAKRSQIMQSRACHHARTTTRTRADKPPASQGSHSEGQRKKRNRRKPRKTKRSGREASPRPPQLAAFCPRKSRLELLPFLPPLLLLKRVSMAPSVVHGSALDIKLVLKPNQSVEGWEESKPRTALQLKVKLVLTSNLCSPKSGVGAVGRGWFLEPTTEA